MSVLTKVLVILVTVLSVGLVAMVIPFVANTENYRQQRDDEVSRRLAAEKRAQLAQGDLTARGSEESERITRLKAESEALRVQINELQQKLDASEAEAHKERANNAKSAADIGKLSATLQQNEAIMKSSLEELAVRREGMARQDTKMIQLAGRNNELEGQLKSLDNQMRRLNEQMQLAEEEKGRLEKLVSQLPDDLRVNLGGATAAAEGAAFVAPAPGIKGQVTKVETVGGRTMLQINVGSVDRVSPNMKFMVFRGGEFLGNLVVKVVDDRSAAGVMELLQGAVTVGDGVVSGGV